MKDPDALAAYAGKVGYPLLVKASAGGGGKGMRVVRDGDELAAALEICRSEAEQAVRPRASSTTAGRASRRSP